MSSRLMTFAGFTILILIVMITLGPIVKATAATVVKPVAPAFADYIAQ